ncbi:MAG: hypothetical protein R3C01_04005 [Planctomycetaceae bacterium]
MATETSFRFIHAADLRLDDVCIAVEGLPGEVLNRLIDARLRAASRVFETAIREQVACVVLAGNLFTRRGSEQSQGAFASSAMFPSATFRSAMFLAEQCQRLASHHITVFWAEADEHPSRQWPAAFPMPVNLVPIDSRQATRMTTRQGHSLLVKQGSATESETCWSTTNSDDRHAFRILVVPSSVVPASAIGLSDGYIAWGGDRGPARISTSAGTVIAAGTTQGDGPDDTGLRGCVVVGVRADRTVTVRFEETAAIHWHLEQTGIDDATGWDSLRSYLHAQSAALSADTAADAVLVRWVMSGHGSTFERLMHPEVRSVLQAEARRVLEQHKIPVHCIELTAVPDAIQQTRWRNGEDSGAMLKLLAELVPRDRSLVDVGQILSDAGREVDAATTQIPEPHFDLKVYPAVVQRIARAMADQKT